MGYSIEQDYFKKLKEFQDDPTFEEQFAGVHLAKGIALVKLMEFTPNFPSEEKGKIFIPKLLTEAAVDLSEVSDSKTAQWEGIRPIVRLIKYGEAPVGHFSDGELENYKLFSVRTEEVCDMTPNPEYLMWMQFATKSPTKGTESMVIPDDVPRKIQGVFVHWAKYRYKDPLNPGTTDDDMLFEIPILKLRSALDLERLLQAHENRKVQVG